MPLQCCTQEVVWLSREWSPCIDFLNFSMQQSRFLYYSSCFTVKLRVILLHCLKVFVRVRIKLKNPNSMFICQVWPEPERFYCAARIQIVENCVEVRMVIYAPLNALLVLVTIAITIWAIIIRRIMVTALTLCITFHTYVPLHKSRCHSCE